MAIPFETIDWEDVPRIEHKGETGTSFSRTKLYGRLRIRIVEYGPGYLADHWCQLGHVIYCLEGEFESEMEDGERFLLKQGMSYVVSNGMSSHRSISADGVKLLIVDGDFLK